MGEPGADRPRVDLEARDDPAPGARPRHAARLLALTEEVLDAGGGWEAVDRIAVGVGPGTFTGLRIGIATAHALARARQLELVGVSTLQSLAAAARAGVPGAAVPGAAIVALIDARRGELFAAAWAAGADPVAAPPSLEPCVIGPDRLLDFCGTLAPDAVAVGDGAVKFRQALVSAGVVVAPADSLLHRVSAREHCSIAARLKPGFTRLVLPQYLRLPDAELTRPP
jgi:tRNA threonylcarbamoyladenosine biosynthesis protein TsaB